MKVDAHQHFWQISRGDYGWITPDVSTLYRDFLPDDLAQHLDYHGITHTIVVQAAPTLEETTFILQLSDNYDSIVGVVGWVDIDSPRFLTDFQKFQSRPKFVGVRVMVQDMDDDALILQDHWIQAFEYFATIDFPVDLLVKSHQLRSVVNLLERVPMLRCVIDHIGKPNIAGAETEPWKREITRISQYTKTYCKLSGMVTEAEHHAWRANDFVEYVRHVIETFGPARTMFGSDWPVCLLSASYDDVVRIATDSLPVSLTQEERKQVFGLTAAQFYKLGTGKVSR